MTLLTAFLVSHFAIIFGALATGGSVLFAMFTHNSAKAKVATANAQVAQIKGAAAQSNVDASQAEVAAVVNASSAQAAAAAAPDSALDADLAKLGALRDANK